MIIKISWFLLHDYPCKNFQLHNDKKQGVIYEKSAVFASDLYFLIFPVNLKTMIFMQLHNAI